MFKTFPRMIMQVYILTFGKCVAVMQGSVFGRIKLNIENDIFQNLAKNDRE